MIKLSVIISTRRREALLANALESLRNQTLDPKHYEIILIDNGPSDETQRLARGFNAKGGAQARYFAEEKTGLHNARHRGAKESRSDILAFTDDDTIADSRWLEETLKSFEDPLVALAGGKILPQWETQSPGWIEYLWRANYYGRYLGYLTIMDLGDEIKEIPAGYVWGANFSIRKNVLYGCGGFHPDAYPPELIKFRGDGESALAATVESRGRKIIYNPASVVYHVIPEGHLKLKYFRRRAFLQGISDSFAEIRKNKGAAAELNYAGKSAPEEIKMYLRPAFVFLKTFSAAKTIESFYDILAGIIEKSYFAGKKYHLNETRKDNGLIEHILRPDYF